MVAPKRPLEGGIEPAETDDVRQTKQQRMDPEYVTLPETLILTCAEDAMSRCFLGSGTCALVAAKYPMIV